ncbi:hypothetical protein BDR26DRAFT_930395 [Obelidium mucronatum]|nr:hypothetical protein BDR26DRAFT_930395 [Obelidium mucronatum]
MATRRESKENTKASSTASHALHATQTLPPALESVAPPLIVDTDPLHLHSTSLNETTPPTTTNILPSQHITSTPAKHSLSDSPRISLKKPRLSSNPSMTTNPSSATIPYVTLLPDWFVSISNNYPTMRHEDWLALFNETLDRQLHDSTFHQTISAAQSSTAEVSHIQSVLISLLIPHVLTRLANPSTNQSTTIQYMAASASSSGIHLELDPTNPDIILRSAPSNIQILKNLLPLIKPLNWSPTRSKADAPSWFNSNRKNARIEESVPSADFVLQIKFLFAKHVCPLEFLVETSELDTISELKSLVKDFPDLDTAITKYLIRNGKPFKITTLQQFLSGLSKMKEIQAAFLFDEYGEICSADLDMYEKQVIKYFEKNPVLHQPAEFNEFYVFHIEHANLCAAKNRKLSELTEDRQRIFNTHCPNISTTEAIHQLNINFWTAAPKSTRNPTPQETLNLKQRNLSDKNHNIRDVPTHPPTNATIWQHLQTQSQRSAAFSSVPFILNGNKKESLCYNYNYAKECKNPRCKYHHFCTPRTPIHIPNFIKAFSTHPNRPLIESVIYSLKHGFAAGDGDLNRPRQPRIYQQHPLSEEDAIIIRKNLATEIAEGRLQRLPHLPNYCSTVSLFINRSKPKPRLIHYLSYPHAHSANDHVPDAEVHVSYDTIQHYIPLLKSMVATCPPDHVAIQWKTDVRHAFRLIPNHPLNSSLQIQMIDGIFYGDCAKSFGCREGPRHWTTISHLVAWYAVNILHIPVYVMMDDFWGICHQHRDDFLANKPPVQMQNLKHFLHQLGIETSDEKDVWGQTITIVGFQVSAAHLTIDLDPNKVTEFMQYLQPWCIPSSHKRKEFDILTGSLNWICNIYFFIKPFISPIYHQCAGKSRHNLILANTPTTDAITWILHHITTCPPTRLLLLESWSPDQANFHIYCDATLNGFGFWISEYQQGYWFHSSNEFQYPDGTPLSIN